MGLRYGAGRGVRAALWGRTWGRLMCYGAVRDGVGLSYGAVL